MPGSLVMRHDASILPNLARSSQSRPFSIAVFNGSRATSGTVRPMSGPFRLRPSIALALALLLPSCGEGDSGAAPPTAGPPAALGQEYVLEEVTIRLPERMVAIDFGRFQDAAALELERRVGGEPGRRLAQQVRAIAEQGLLDFCAFDPSTPGDGIAENVNVIIAPLPPGTDRDAVLSQNLAQFGAAGITVLATDEFAVGDLVFDRFRTRMDRAGTEGQAYILVHDGKVHTITFTAGRGSAEEFLRDAEPIVRDYRPR